MLQFLYLRNIGVFLTACSKVFALKESVLFDAGDLVDGKDFGKVSAPIFNNNIGP